MQTLSFSTLALATLLLTACGPGIERSSSSKAIVSDTELSAASELFATIDYLPSDYIVSGCSERATYVAMELVAADIPVSYQYLNNSMRPTPEVSWFYHVAAAIKTESDAEPWILDPAFSMAPMTRSEWVKRSKAFGKPKLTLQDTISESPEVVGLWSSDSLIDDSEIVKDFASVPRFETRELYSACVVMHEYLKKTSRSPEEILSTQAKLLARTTELMQALDVRDKLKVSDMSNHSSLFKPCHQALNDWIIFNK